ncbi:MAG: DUF5103 domain-containing protein [Bacteroidota bacterium]|nr:DUF5103 domain-containing protein [Bacteroidota bacterium]
MNGNKKIIIGFVFLIINTLYGFSLPRGPLPDAVFDRNIKTVQLYKEGWEFSYPILELNDTKTLQFSFDYLGTKSKNLNYIVVHCDAQWEPSRIAYSEYLDGFYQNPLLDFQTSESTHIPYLHYSFAIPNESVKLKLSGNYALVVFENSNEDNPLIIKRFVVVDQKVTIVPEVKRPTLPVYQDNYQQVGFSILHPDYSIDNPFQTVKIAVIKNNQWKFSVQDMVPLYVRNAELVYDYQDKGLFPGGNEYRSFDIKSLKYKSANIQSIDYVIDSWHVELKPDKPRNQIAYFYDEDFNGKYLVQNKQGTNAATDAEYVHVIFTFPMSEPLISGNIYVFGGFCDYNCYDDYRMVYNVEKKAYVLDILLKQGYYNYQYVFVPENSSDVDDRYFEGSFYETENDYLIYVYHRPFGARYDKLIGVKLVNSLKRSGLQMIK